MAKKIVKKSAKKSTQKTAKKAAKKVSPIPAGYNTVTPYLIVEGALDAIAFYKKAFGAKAVMCMDEGTGKVGHAELQIGDTKIMLADECPKMNARSPKAYNGSPVSIHLYMNDVDAVVKKAVAAGAKLIRPVEDMFYGDRSGGITDPFGHTWYIATHVEDLTMAQVKKRMAEMCQHKGTCDEAHG